MFSWETGQNSWGLKGLRYWCQCHQGKGRHLNLQVWEIQRSKFAFKSSNTVRAESVEHMWSSLLDLGTTFSSQAPEVGFRAIVWKLIHPHGPGHISRYRQTVDTGKLISKSECFWVHPVFRNPMAGSPKPSKAVCSRPSITWVHSAVKVFPSALLTALQWCYSTASCAELCSSLLCF